MDKAIKENYVIIDVEKIGDRLKSATRCEAVSTDDAIEFIENEASTVFFVDAMMNVKQEGDRAIEYAWLDTGYINPDGDPVFISLIKDGAGMFSGNFVAPLRTVAGKIATYKPANKYKINENIPRFMTKYEKRIAKRERKHLEQPDLDAAREMIEKRQQKEAEKTQTQDAETACTAQATMEIPKAMSPVTEEVSGILLVKNWKTMEGLDRYLKIVGCRAKQLAKEKAEGYFVINHLGYVVVNTGLLNQFGADILVYYRTNKKYDMFEPYQVIHGKADFLENGFTKEQASAEIKPMNFLGPDDIFSADISDFDLNYRNLQHIIDERRDRFPDGIKELPTSAMAMRLTSALEQGLKMQERDRNYAKPHYSAKTRDISWLLPFHVNSQLIDEPELVLVIRKNKDFYELKTILPYDDRAKDKVTALSLYSEIW